MDLFEMKTAEQIRQEEVERRIHEALGEEVNVIHTPEAYQSLIDNELKQAYLRAPGMKDPMDQQMEEAGLIPRTLTRNEIAELRAYMMRQRDRLMNNEMQKMENDLIEARSTEEPVNTQPVQESRWERKKREKEEKKNKEELRNWEKNTYEGYEDVKKSEYTVDPEFLNKDYVKKEVYTKTVEYKEDGKSVKVKQGDLVTQVLNGDYSHMEQMEPSLRHLLAAQYMAKHDIRVTPQELVNSLKEKGVSEMMNPLLRLGISLGMGGNLPYDNMGHLPIYYRQIDALLNAEIMTQTLLAKGNENTTEEENLRNQVSNTFILKTMFLAQVGKFVKKEKGTVEEWKGPVANAFAHCSRVGFILPAEDEIAIRQDRYRSVLGTYLGDTNNPQMGFYKRKAATHSLIRKSKNGRTKFQEEKTHATLSNQYGMDVAVGGLGNPGITGANKKKRPLKNDGTCGHLYMHLREGDEQNYTGILLGFESDSYKKTNQLGHTHGFGNGEFASSFGGQRVDEIGDKIGGREVDLTYANASALRTLMNDFEVKMRIIAQNNPVKYEELVRKLCGERMDTTQFKTFCADVFGDMIDSHNRDEFMSYFYENRVHRG